MRRGFRFRDFGFDFGFPPFGFYFRGPWIRHWRTKKEEYLKMLEEYKKDLEEELKEVEREIKEMKKEG
jgi:hypothetical protein